MTKSESLCSNATPIRWLSFFKKGKSHPTDHHRGKRPRPYLIMRSSTKQSLKGHILKPYRQEMENSAAEILW